MPYAPGTQPVPSPGAGPPVAPSPGVMSRRWAIGVDVGPESYAPKVEPQPQATSFGQLELAARYRVVAPIEVELALHLGGSKDISEGGFYLGGRYRFLAEQALNIYGLFDLGVLAVAHKDASDQAKKGRGSLRLGVGGEYRWSWFALVVEFRLMTVGNNADLGPSTIMPEPVDYQLSRYQLAGASFAMGANFYF